MADRHNDTVRSRIRGLARHGQNRSTGPYIGPTATHKGWLRDSSLEADPRAFFLENCSSKPDEALSHKRILKRRNKLLAFGRFLWRKLLRWQLENSHVLALMEIGQQNDRAIHEFQSIVVCRRLVFVNLLEAGDRPAELAEPGLW
jgi:hypothetical protein